MNKIEIFTALDLELNQPSNKIIQIGAVTGNITTGQVIDRFRVYVNPHEKLGFCKDGANQGKSITQLTGIKQEQVDNGLSLFDAYIQLRDFHKQSGAFINPIVWGGGDSLEIKQQLTEECGHVWPVEENWCFGRRWIDAKTLFVSWRLANGKQVQGGLARAMTKFGLKFKGREHDAQDDAENTFLMYHTMLQLLKKE